MSKQEQDTTMRAVAKEGQEAAGAGPVMTETRKTTVSGPITWEEMHSLLRREPVVYERTWRPTTGGLLSILAGSWSILIGIGAILAGIPFSSSLPSFSFYTGSVTLAGSTAGGILIVLGIVSIVGGVYALSRRMWGMALAGSITSLVSFSTVIPFLLGIFSLIFTVLGHPEFKPRHTIT